jgi:hypothetical protein
MATRKRTLTGVVRVKDWVAWHRAYDDPASSLSIRLERVRWHLARALDQAPPGPVRLVSLCAGQGLDVLGVLPGHSRRRDVSALLVEADPLNAEVARAGAASAGLDGVRVRKADASLVACFADALPADVLLLCGIFGNVSAADIRRTVDAAASLCADGATVIWTRHRRPPDITDQVRDWFGANGFDEVAFEALQTDSLTGVGVHRLARRSPRAPGYPEQRFFTFGSNRA